MTPEYVRELFDYDPETGALTWRVQRTNRVKVGMIAGRIEGKGYRQVNIDGKLYMGHRVVWFYVHGEWPDGEIDHINGDKLDNRIANLRVVTRGENLQNHRKPYKNNRSGFLGVCWHGAARGWAAQIQVHGKNHRLGIFPTPELAHAAYLEAKARLHPCSTITQVAEEVPA